jgi:hemolysin III
MLHAVAILLSIGGVAWLFFAVMRVGSLSRLLVLTVYSVGLIGMFIASAAYNSCFPGDRKEQLRCVDRAMIFVMIAGTGTPFALSAFPETIGLSLCTLIWITAVIGATLTLAFPRRFERPLFALYLIMGWIMFGFGLAYADNFSNLVAFLLLGGGVAYSCGAIIHTQSRLPFHNVAWHGLVLLGAGLHWTAVASQVMNWRGP